MSTSTMASTPNGSAGSFNVALLQLRVTASKDENIPNAVSAIEAAVEQSAKDGAKKLDLIMLPEVWNSPYVASEFPNHCEPVPEVGEACDAAKGNRSLAPIAELAVKHGVTILAGSIPEEASAEGGKKSIYNTSVTLCPSTGKVLAKHRKVHLFDIDIPGKIRFFESETLTGGGGITVVDVPWLSKKTGDAPPPTVKLGVAICYDIRFAEFILLMRQRGAQVMCFPAAFNTVTGPRHWHLCLRARAVDTQCHVLACSPARNESGYQAFGHSLSVTPWGDITAEAEETPTTIVAQLDMGMVEEARGGIPIGKQRRHDMYTLEEKAKMPRLN